MDANHTIDNRRLSPPAFAFSFAFAFVSTTTGAGINQLYCSRHTHFRHDSHPNPTSLFQSRSIPPKVLTSLNALRNVDSVSTSLCWNYIIDCLMKMEITTDLSFPNIGCICLQDVRRKREYP